MDINDAKKVLNSIPPPSFGLMKISEAAALTGLHPETLRRRVRRGELRAWGFPRRVSLSDVMKQFIPPAVREVAESGENRGSNVD
jgi:excisionase family DNA binding protein